MFSHILSSDGRIGRLEYFLTLVISWILAGIMIAIGIFVISENEIIIETGLQERIFLICTLGPSIVLVFLAGQKRVHDAGSPEWLAFAPVVLILYPHLFTLIFAILGTIYLLKDRSEDKINEYGTIPSLHYDKQITMLYSEE